VAFHSEFYLKSAMKGSFWPVHSKSERTPWEIDIFVLKCNALPLLSLMMTSHHGFKVPSCILDYIQFHAHAG